MKVRDPQPFIDRIDWDVFNEMRAQGGQPSNVAFEYSAPSQIINLGASSVGVYSSEGSKLPSKIRGKIQRFGDNIDTDAV
jgi:hypothetical protein